MGKKMRWQGYDYDCNLTEKCICFFHGIFFFTSIFPVGQIICMILRVTFFRKGNYEDFYFVNHDTF